MDLKKLENSFKKREKSTLAFQLLCINAIKEKDKHILL